MESRSEIAVYVRTMLGQETGWSKFMTPALVAKYDQVRDQFLLEMQERHPDFKEWSNEKLAGYALALFWVRQLPAQWLRLYDEAVAAQALQNAPEPEPNGHPYVADPSLEPAND